MDKPTSCAEEMDPPDHGSVSSSGSQVTLTNEYHELEQSQYDKVWPIDFMEMREKRT